jgi:hypothetical protein
MFTLLAGLGGALLGLFKFLIAKHMEYSNNKWMAHIKSEQAVNRSRKLAQDVSDSGVSFTRRVLAFMLCGSLCAIMLYGLFVSDATISVPETYMSKSFWDYIIPWKDGKELVRYVEVKAPVLAMPLVDLSAAVVGFYFGSGGSKMR